MLNSANLESIIAAFDKIDCGAVIYGPNFEPIYSNSNTQRNFPVLLEKLKAGCSMEESVEANVRAVRTQDSDEMIRKFTAYFMKKILSGEEVEFETSDNRVVRAYHARRPDGGYLGLSADITELKRNEAALRCAQQQAEAANRAKSLFLATMSHEIRTPLNGVLGMAQALERRPLASAEQQMVETIVQCSRDLLAILNDILDISKIEAGRIDLAPAPGDLRLTVRQVEQLYREQAAAKGVELRAGVAANVPNRLVFDPVRVRQCLVNLVSNAIKFTDTGAVHVAVSAETLAGERVRIIMHVRDTGIGIDASDIEKLFQNFTQVDRSAARRFGGAGLGLSITRKLLQKMGGDVRVVSAPGEGSVFTLHFEADIADTPARAITPERRGDKIDRQDGLGVSSAPAAAPLTAPASGALSGIRALLVDDTVVNRLVARALLDPFGLDIDEVASGQAALDALHHERYDLVLLDVHMPVMDGQESLLRIRSSGQSWADVPVIALTADAMDGDRDKYLAMGMDGYASKPVEERELVTEIQAVLARRGRARKVV
ncbi:MAG: ATP-binding protein [Pseudomonadota bacterium]